MYTYYVAKWKPDSKVSQLRGPRVRSFPEFGDDGERVEHAEAEWRVEDVKPGRVITLLEFIVGVRR